MLEALKELIKDVELAKKILEAKAFHGKLSIIYLMHKFKFNSLMAKKIMNIVVSFEKEKKCFTQRQRK